MDAVATTSFIHAFEPGTDANRTPLLLLHGTGGDERDLLPLGRMVAPGAALLSPRGQVLEGSMPRFFRRLSEGVFDEDDLRRRTHELADFIKDISRQYGLAAPVAVGFSNGANIAASLLLLRPEVLAGAALLRAMSPFAKPPRADLTGKRVQLLSGAFDPIVPADDAERLATTLASNGAAVDHRTVPTGHGLSQADIGLLKTWLDKA
ncbi:alpha/beta hydrolase [Bosea caraganae]|uniref:Alpha/beta hydrolase n=1 Tax=Bosea caraganae TaxID=2763117 RepID=A0A370L5T4_9HYPH|nr:alpha/beta hydrolase [Bosea caraganae]RDJ23283.1 alpha/beta hydrolase [Bosea caraganae]RDJ24604.1 alpha/beta hydrolase [Bosea caraganae]